MEPAERVQAFYNRLKEMAKKCKLNDADNMIRDQLIVGLRPDLFEKLSERPREIQLNEALDLALAAEMKVTTQQASSSFNETTYKVGSSGVVSD